MKVRPAARTRAGTHLAVRAGLPVGIAAAVVCLAAGPALAATNISISADGTTIGDGDVVDHNGSLTVKGSTDATASSRQLKLTVSVPGGGDHTLKTGSAGALQSGQLSASIDTGCPDWSDSPCVEAVNGTYTFTFTAGSSDSSTHVQLRVPPAAPNGFQATVNGTVVSFSWAPNSEPDVLGYDIVDGSGYDVTPGGVDADSVCDSSGCGVSIDFGPSAEGTSRTFALDARRHTSPGSSGFVSSSDSASQTVNFPAPPAPAGSPSGSSTGGGGGGGSRTGGGSSGNGGVGPGGVTSGGRTHGSRHLSGKNPAADLRRTLPTVTAAGAPDLPTLLTEVKPLPEGTFKPTLAYPDQVTKEKSSQPAPAAAQVLHDFRKVLDTGALWRSLAGAVVLILAAVHLRAFVERVEAD